MTTKVEEAYHQVMQILCGLEELGIKVDMVETGDKETAKKYAPPERLPVELWRHVTIYPTNEEQFNHVMNLTSTLYNEHGISFDTGYCFGDGGRDWELDWSFSVEERN